MTQDFKDKLKLSSRKRRIAAYFIDHFTMTFVIVAIAFMALGTDFLNQENFSAVMTKILPTMLIGFLLYFAKDSIQGISPGKWIMGIMVRDEKSHTETPSIGRLLIRNLFIIIWPVEFIVLAASPEKKRLGDKTAKTIVVQNPNKPTKLPRILALVGIGVVYFSFILLFVGAAIKNSDAYKVAIIEIEKNEEIIKETGGIEGYGFFPTGNINVSNGNGEAQLGIKVLGNEKDINIDVYLTKEPNGEWQLIEMGK